MVNINKRVYTGGGDSDYDNLINDIDVLLIDINLFINSKNIAKFHSYINYIKAIELLKNYKILYNPDNLKDQNILKEHDINSIDLLNAYTRTHYEEILDYIITDIEGTFKYYLDTLDKEEIKNIKDTLQNNYILKINKNKLEIKNMISNLNDNKYRIGTKMFFISHNADKKEKALKKLDKYKTKLNEILITLEYLWNHMEKYNSISSNGGNTKIKNKKNILGKEKCIYKISGNRKEYVKHDGELITLKDYKKIIKLKNKK
jgi:hypothetical protein